MQAKYALFENKADEKYCNLRGQSSSLAREQKVTNETNKASHPSQEMALTTEFRIGGGLEVESKPANKIREKAKIKKQARDIAH